jgi:hypothetical protein
MKIENNKLQIKYYLLYSIFLILYFASFNINAEASKNEPEKKKVRIIVFDFEAGKDFNKEDAKTVTDFIRNHMIDKNRYDVVDRKNIDKVLKEVAIQQKCGVSGCEVEIGRYLHADKNMTGTISKFGSSYTINATITDVKQGKYDYGISKESSTIQGLKEASEKLVEELTIRIDSGDDSKTDTKFSFPTINPIIKSAILPGWGQYSNGYKLKGALTFVSFFLVTGAFIVEKNNYDKAHDKYQTNSNWVLLYPSSSNLDIMGYAYAKSLHSDHQKHGEQATTLSALAIGIYLYNIFDIAFISKNANVSSINLYKKEGLALNTSVQRNQVALDRTVSIQYTWSF